MSDAFDELEEWTCGLAELHEALSDPIWQQIGKTIPTGRAGTFDKLAQFLLDTCREYDAKLTPGMPIGIVMRQLKAAIDRRDIRWCKLRKFLVVNESCTCTACSQDCKGECGCVACKNGYQSFLDGYPDDWKERQENDHS